PPPRLLAQLDLQAPAYVADLLERPRRQRSAIAESPERGAHPPRQGPIAQEQPRPRQALPLPEIPVLLIVPFKSVDARGEAAALAAGTQAQVDGEGDAGRRDVAEGSRQPLDGAAVEGVGVDALQAIGLAIRRVGISA